MAWTDETIPRSVRLTRPLDRWLREQARKMGVGVGTYIRILLMEAYNKKDDIGTCQPTSESANTTSS